VFLVDELKPKIEAVKKEYVRLKNIKKPKLPSNSTMGNSTSSDNPKKSKKREKTIKLDGEDINIDGESK